MSVAGSLLQLNEDPHMRRSCNELEVARGRHKSAVEKAVADMVMRHVIHDSSTMACAFINLRCKVHLEAAAISAGAPLGVVLLF